MNVYELLTAPGPAAIAVIRLRGEAVAGLVAGHFRRGGRVVEPAAGRVVHGDLLGIDGQPLDDVVIVVDQGGPDWDARLHLHGGPGVHAACVALLQHCGFREQQADAASLWDATDEIEAELFGLLPRMMTMRGVRWLMKAAAEMRAARRGPAASPALESLPAFRLFARPTRIALVGPPNAGKSTLMNRLADMDVSIVSETPGTTRDWIEAAGELDGFPIVWLDTAGLRHSPDEIEAEGVRRSLALLANSDQFVLVLDAAALGEAAVAIAAVGESGRTPAAVLWNKSDRGVDSHAEQSVVPETWRAAAMEISALTGAGVEAFLDGLRGRIFPPETALTGG